MRRGLRRVSITTFFVFISTMCLSLAVTEILLNVPSDVDCSSKCSELFENLYHQQKGVSDQIVCSEGCCSLTVAIGDDIDPACIPIGLKGWHQCS
jgi:hypothetical protein